MKKLLMMALLLSSFGTFAQAYKELDTTSRFIVQSTLENNYSNLSKELKITHKSDKQIVNVINLSNDIQANLKTEISELKAKIAQLESDCTVGKDPKVNQQHSNQKSKSSSTPTSTSTGTTKN